MALPWAVLATAAEPLARTECGDPKRWPALRTSRRINDLQIALPRQRPYEAFGKRPDKVGVQVCMLIGWAAEVSAFRGGTDGRYSTDPVQGTCRSMRMYCNCAGARRNGR